LRYCIVAGYIGFGRHIPLLFVHSGKTFVFPLIGAFGAEGADAGWYPAAAHVVPGSRRGVPSPMAAGRRALPPGRGPGFGFAGNRGLNRAFFISQ